jgi:hypothetical protein
VTRPAACVALQCIPATARVGERRQSMLQPCCSCCLQGRCLGLYVNARTCRAQTYIQSSAHAGSRGSRLEQRLTLLLHVCHMWALAAAAVACRSAAWGRHLCHSMCYRRRQVCAPALPLPLPAGALRWVAMHDIVRAMSSLQPTAAPLQATGATRLEHRPATQIAHAVAGILDNDL